MSAKPKTPPTETSAGSAPPETPTGKPGAAGTSPASMTPEFDALAAKDGNPLGPREDMPRPKFTLTIPPFEWPDVDEVLGPRPTPRTDPEATLEVAPVDLAANPDVHSALALLDNGAVPAPVDVPEASAK